MDTDARLLALEQARQGDREALGALLDSFRPYLRTVVRLVRDGRPAAPVDDSDLIQDALVAIQQAFVGFRGQSVAELAAWIRAIALRTASRSLHRFPTVAGEPEQGLDGLAGSAATPATLAIQHDQETRLTEALGQLPLEMQQVVLGRHLDGLDHAALALRLGRSEGATRVLYSRALAQLRQPLGE